MSDSSKKRIKEGLKKIGGALLIIALALVGKGKSDA